MQVNYPLACAVARLVFVTEIVHFFADGSNIGENADALELAWDPENLLGDVADEEKDLIGERLKVLELGLSLAAQSWG